MKKTILRSFIIFVLMWIGNSSVSAESKNTIRQKINIDFDWKFQQTDIKQAQRVGFDDSSWGKIDLPHDWSIEGKYSRENPTDWQGGYLPAGIGWYRKNIEWKNEWQGKKIFVQFDGVYMNSDVWINGVHLGKRPNGYISFYYDLTEHLKKGKNVLAVRVDHSKALSSRWYTGSGIYSHVWLVVTDPVHVVQWVTYITTPKVSKEKVSVRIKTKIQNESYRDGNVILASIIKNENNQTVAEVESENKIPAGSSYEFTQDCQVLQPKLWSPDSPDLYTVISLVKTEKGIVDNYQTDTGFRKLEFSPEWGFKLNDKKLKLKGVCEHHTAGCVGSAVPDDVLYRRLNLLKDMGCNAVRTAHNPFAPVFYQMCDRLGLMVMNEAFDGWDKPKARDDYGNYFEQWWQRDLTDFITRDRNHPCIIMWSIGNEVNKPTKLVQEKLVTLCHNLDPTRPVTQGGSDPTRGMKLPEDYEILDIAGFNGGGEEKGNLENFKTKFPDVCAVGTEIPHTLQTRGVYRTKTHWRKRDFPAPWENSKGWEKMQDKVFAIPNLTLEEVFTEETQTLYYQSSYDNASVRIGARNCWQRTESFDWLMGEFRWTGFDYLGEAKWPTRLANMGVIDICGFPKDHYYLYKSLWADEPMVHLLPHWTHTGKEGVEIPVVAYTNCQSVELFLNNKSLGTKSYTGQQLVWKVPYQPGNLLAVARINGQQVAIDERITAGKASAIKITSDKHLIQANKTDVVHLEIDIVDDKGNFQPYGDDMITFDIQGPAKLIGTDNGDPLDLSGYKTNQRKAFRGKCLAIIQATDTSGEIVVTAKADNLKPAVITIEQKN